MDAIERAGRFLEGQGREIDRARFARHFRDGSREALLAALGGYQNADGGFGRGLEPDIKAPGSNPFATELALLICLQANMPRDEPLLQRAVAYLERTQHEDGDWRFTEGVYRHELAPWFRGWEWPNLNPGCTIAGLLKELGLGSAELHGRVERLFARLANPEDVAKGDGYAVRPYAYYFLPEWEYPQREFYLSGLLWWVMRLHFGDAEVDGDHFFGYVRGPQTYVGRRLPEAIVADRLDRLVAEQEGDGGWPTPYDPAWRPWTTLQNLLVLRAFGRL